MDGSDGHAIEQVRGLLRQSEHRVQRQRGLVAAMERLGDHHGAIIVRELLRIELATLRLAQNQLQRLHRQQALAPARAGGETGD